MKSRPSDRFAFADHMLDAAATFSLRERRFRYLNNASEKILGVPRAAALEDPALFFRLLVDDDHAAGIAFLKQMEKDGVAAAELRFRHKDGQLRWIALRSFPIDDEGEPLRAIIGEDISERKRIEQALRESEARFRQVVENIEEVFWIVAADGTQVHYVSPAYEKIWGAPASDLYAAPFKWMQAVHPADQARVMDSVTSQQSQKPLEIQFRLVNAAGELRHIRHRSAPVRDASGRTVQVVCMSEDITEQKRLEIQAEEATRAQRDALVREVHHRIKNNLQGVTGMLRNYANQHAELAGLINEAIAQVQAVAIIYGLQGRPGAARVMLGDLLKEIVSGIGQLMHKGIEVRNEEHSVGCLAVVSELEAVPVALVLNEMIFNAVKHGEADEMPTIEMKIDIARERVTLTIANAGHLPQRRHRASPHGGSGLQLIRALLPRRSAHFELTNGANGVQAKLTLDPPIVTLQC